MANLNSKFRGCLLGALIGDCLGSPFENDFIIIQSKVKDFLKGFLNENEIVTKIYHYTDDTAMTKSVAQSLLCYNGFNAVDLAKRFTEEYYQDLHRGYGQHVIDVFESLKACNYEEPFEPARKQFSGGGSYGNGAAMRISPAALYGYNYTDNELIDLVKNISLITHYHKNGYNGAILQSFAIHQALHSIEDIEPKDFIDILIKKMKNVEEQDDIFSLQLKKMKQIIETKSEVPVKQIVKLFGNEASAHKSVSSAIYSALKSKIFTEDFDNVFVRTLYNSISLGGDTDTIASMACAIIGAMYGHEIIPKRMIEHCEAVETITKLSDQLAKSIEV